MLTSLRRLLNALLSQNVVELMDKFKEKLPGTKSAYEHNGGLMKGKELPTLETIFYFLETLLAVASLSKRVSDLSPKIFENMSAEIGKSLFMNFNMFGIATTSRIALLCQCVFASSIHCFEAWQPALSWTLSVNLDHVRADTGRRRYSHASSPPASTRISA